MEGKTGVVRVLSIGILAQPGLFDNLKTRVATMHQMEDLGRLNRRYSKGSWLGHSPLRF
jgi:hypothetical protein